MVTRVHEALTLQGLSPAYLSPAGDDCSFSANESCNNHGSPEGIPELEDEEEEWSVDANE